MKAQDLIKKLQEIGNKTDADIEKVESIDGAVVVTFKKEEVFENKLPKSWEEFCEMYEIKKGECYIDTVSGVNEYTKTEKRRATADRSLLPDRATAEAILALCQLIQLRNAFNGDLVPEWMGEESKFVVEFQDGKITCNNRWHIATSPLYFKTRELRDEFLSCFRPLIEKLKPLYGIKEGGEE